MYLLDTLVACPACNCHARAAERTCPHCGSPLRRDDGTTPRTAGAILLGLIVATAAPTLASCGGTIETRGGGGATSTTGSGGASSKGGAGGTGGATGSTTTSSEGCGGFPISADYGVPPTSTACPPGGGGSGP